MTDYLNTVLIYVFYVLVFLCIRTNNMKLRECVAFFYSGLCPSLHSVMVSREKANGFNEVQSLAKGYTC